MKDELKTYNLNFDGYWREINKQYAPDFSGVYLIYTCKFIPEDKTVSLAELIYIGQAKNIRKRIADHSTKEFASKLKQGMTLCYACASVDEKDLDIVENALVFAEKPLFNDKLKENYNFDDAQFIIEGTCAKLKYTSYSIKTSNYE